MPRKQGDITETQFATQVEDLLMRFGWRWMHMKPAKRTAIKTGRDFWVSHMNPEGKGYPDYTAVRLTRLLFIELKDRLSKPTPEQESWLGDLRECVKMITLEPIEVTKTKRQTITNIKSIIPSFEVYLWRPADIDKIVEILR